MTLICDFFPSWFSVCCASIISAILFLLGGVDIPLIWLFIFVVIDYLSGSWYAIKSGNWSSSVGGKGIIKKIIIFLMVVIANGGKGIIKKIIIFLMVVIANGIDQSTGINYIRQAVIIAYLINESGSILENIENLGYGSIIPSVLRKGLKAINQKNNLSDNLSDAEK